MVSFAPNEVVLACSTPVIYSNTSGTLYFTSKRLTFVEEKTQKFTVSLPHASIMRQLVNPETARVLMLKVECNDNSPKGTTDYKFAFKSETAVADRTSIKEAISTMKQNLETLQNSSTNQPSNGSTSSQPPRSSNLPSINRNLKATNKLTDADAIIRCSILKKAPRIAALHRELVIEGVLSEEEFWENRQFLLRNQSAELGQKKAQSTAWIDIKPSAQDGNEIKYTLTPELIHTIFLQHPSVQQAYDENVPDQISEAAFWKRFFGSKYFHRNRSVSRVNVDTEDDIFDKLLIRDDEAAHALGEKYDPTAINRTIDLFASEQDHGETGNKPNITMQPGRQRDAMSLIRRFNFHSDQVIRSSRPDPAKVIKDTSYKNEIVYDDLKLKSQPAFIPLDVQNQSILFNTLPSSSNNLKRKQDEAHHESKPKSGESQRNTKAFYSNLAGPIAVDLKQITRNTDAVNSANQGLYEIMLEQRNLKRTKTSLANDISESTLDALITIQQTGNELLRHFWACTTATENKGGRASDRAANLAAKRDRMIQALQPIQDRLKKLFASIGKTNEKEARAASRIIKSLVDGIRRAREVYLKSTAGSPAAPSSRSSGTSHPPTAAPS